MKEAIPEVSVSSEFSELSCGPGCWVRLREILLDLLFDFIMIQSPHLFSGEGDGISRGFLFSRCPRLAVAQRTLISLNLLWFPSCFFPAEPSQDRILMSSFSERISSMSLWGRAFLNFSCLEYLRNCPKPGWMSLEQTEMVESAPKKAIC